MNTVLPTLKNFFLDSLQSYQPWRFYMSGICISIRTPEIYSEVLYRKIHISRLEELRPRFPWLSLALLLWICVRTLLEHPFLVHLCLHIWASDRDRLKQLEQERQITNKNQGQCNGSTGKGICCQAGHPEFDPWNLYGGRKNQLLKAVVSLPHVH